ncbi:MAG: hypothetical protein ACOX3E_01915 [Desulfomonilia bacterium]|jgi:hypothetical protein|uniref:Uncharacterized protein n=1 Tax=anaerobic digester metagenome TaxID=1263854 RepID=A0A485M1G0_9ZZZZ|nr:hypothetical protein [Pseudomonadota bacterium]HON38793.1 hypothetical protein [Deltaproteobacteria bacterium]HRS56670.1 hypothetical protein [Desulfomonilia bacterium]HPD20287.1 hypothetical protein [Deltaproteobacteria bacterium]HPX17672.1 hypothetical protein [Deltaproteobacteria bacterium]
MDTQALELWGNTFLNAARGQKLMEEYSRMMAEGFGSFQDIFGMFRKYWGLDFFLQEMPRYFTAYLKAAEDIQRMFIGGVFSLMSNPMGYPSPAGYQALRKDYEELREKTLRQEEDIRRLRTILDEKLSAQSEGIAAFQNLMKSQAEQFQDMMVNFSKLFSRSGSTEAAGGQEKQAREPAPKKRSPSSRKT